MTDLRSEGVVMIMRLFESMLRSTGNNGVELIKPALPFIFKYDYFYKSLNFPSMAVSASKNDNRFPYEIECII